MRITALASQSLAKQIYLLNFPGNDIAAMSISRIAEALLQNVCNDIRVLDKQVKTQSLKHETGR